MGALLERPHHEKTIPQTHLKIADPPVVYCQAECDLLFASGKQGSPFQNSFDDIIHMDVFARGSIQGVAEDIVPA